MLPWFSMLFGRERRWESLLLEAREWRRWPVLAPGGYDDALRDVEGQTVVGESHYQSTLEKFAGGRTEHGVVVRRVMASLKREPSNNWDRNAVQVLVGGQLVGYLPRTVAKQFGPILLGMEGQGEPATCRAQLTGGWDRGPADSGSIGIVLDVAVPPRLCLPGEDPFLPGEKEIAIVGEENFQPQIRTMPSEFVAELSLAEENPERPKLEGPHVLVRGDGALIGWLGAARAARLLPLLEEVRRTGFPASCHARSLAGAKNVQVKMLIPDEEDQEQR